MEGSLVILEGSSWLRFFYSMDGSLIIMEGSLLSRFLLLQWIVGLSLWKVVCCRDFVTPKDGSLVIMEGSLLS